MADNEDRSNQGATPGALAPAPGPGPTPGSAPALALAVQAEVDNVNTKLDQLSMDVRSTGDRIWAGIQSILDRVLAGRSTGPDERAHLAVSSTGHLVAERSPTTLSSVLPWFDGDQTRGYADSSASTRGSSIPTMTSSVQDAQSEDGGDYARIPTLHLDRIEHLEIPELPVSIEDTGICRTAEMVIRDWCADQLGSRLPRYGGQFDSWEGGYSVIMLVWPNAQRKTTKVEKKTSEKRPNPRMQVQLHVVANISNRLCCKLSLFCENGRQDAPVTWASPTESGLAEFILDGVPDQPLRLQCRITKPEIN